MSDIKQAKTRFPVNAFSRNRWSPRAFSSRPVEKEKVCSLFEAARWAPSSGNQQPWHFLVGFREDPTYEGIFETLDEWNRKWVKGAPLLLLSIGRRLTARSHRENFHYAYDTGQSLACLTVEAMNLGLYVHQMGGFDAQKAIERFRIPGDFFPLTAVVIGYIGDPGTLEEEYRKAELEPRMRRDFDAFVFAGMFGEKSGLF